MKPLLTFLKIITYSNIFVAICVTAFTHLTYIIYQLPKDNMWVILIMIFSFTFFTYNGQRFFRLRKKKSQLETIGERLNWVIKYKNILTFFTVLFGIIGLICTYYINPYCWIILIPMGIISILYVAPIIPFYSKSPTLRELPYLKIIFIATVWSIAIIWLPLVDTHFGFGNSINLFAALAQNFLFVIAITLPFDIRDIAFDKKEQLKTIPQLIGIKNTIVLSESLLIASIILFYFSNLNIKHFYALLVGYILTIVLIAFSIKKRKELFFAGLIEGTVLILYCNVLIVEYFFL